MLKKYPKIKCDHVSGWEAFTIRNSKVTEESLNNRNLARWVEMDKGEKIFTVIS